jgi:hypothetical protein
MADISVVPLPLTVLYRNCFILSCDKMPVHDKEESRRCDAHFSAYLIIVSCLVTRMPGKIMPKDYFEMWQSSDIWEQL